jgi:hypothetical protein
MKRILVFVFFLICAGSPQAADLESYEFVDRLLSLSEPAAPFIFEDAVVFTASSGLRRVGVAFAHEGFSKVHWFKKLMTPQDITTAPIPPGKKAPEPY